VAAGRNQRVAGSPGRRNLETVTLRSHAPRLVAILLVAIAPQMGAQVVRGVVTMPDGTTRASGVIIAAAGDTGAPARALTNQRGAFTIQLRAPGRYSLSALRIGFRPTDGPTITVATGDTISVQFRLTGSAVSLQVVTVRGNDICRTSPDSGALVAKAWEEARKAIMASQLAATDAPLVAEWIEYNRTLDATGRFVRGLRVRTSISPTTHAFRSAPAESLATRGYVVPDGGETTYHAPDGDVLLSDSFAATHCFQVVLPGRGADTLVGVAFRPARDQRDLRDIEGTFWLDRRSAELRWMDYRYTNMPSIADKASPGGRVEFLRLGTGGWLVGRWSIRMPEFGRASTSVDAGRMRVVRPPSAGVLTAIQVSGGQVTKVLRGDTLVYQAAGAALDVQLLSSDESVQVAGATVELLGTDYVAVARADGRARIEPVLEGRYEARIRTPLMDTLGVPPIAREVEIVTRPRTDTVRVATSEELVRAACRDSLGGANGLVRGTVRDSLGRPISLAAVLVTWQGRPAAGSERGRETVAWTEQSAAAMSDANGRWRTCNVPRGVLFTVRVKTDAGSDARRLRIEEDRAMITAELVPRPVRAAAADAIPNDNRALLDLWATDDDGALLQGVTLDVEVASGVTRTISTGITGHALVPDVEPGRITVRARKIGFKAGQLVVSVAAGRNTVPIIMSSMDLPTLDTVRIVGDERRRNDRLDEFETRRLNAMATRSITRAEIVKRNPVSTWQMLTNVPSVKIAEQGGVVIARTTRADVTSFKYDLPCYMKVMVDGVLLAEDSFSVPPSGERSGIPQSAANLAHLPPPDAIHGIEVFAGPASIPLQYGGSGSNKWCGLIAVWTR